MDEIHWFVGIDWATKIHQVCLADAKGKRVGEREFPHGGAGLADLCHWLEKTTAAAPGAIAVAIEVPHGPVVAALLERGFLVHAINPKQLDRFRDRFTAAGAKDDRRDARVLADSLRTDPHAFRRVATDPPVVIELREWSRMAEDLQQERIRLTNRMRDQLWRYYPQMLELKSDLDAEWFLELWHLAPTPADAARIRESTVARILKAHRIRRLDAAQVLRILRQKPLALAPGAVAAATVHIRTVVVRLRLVNQQLKEAYQQLDELSAKLDPAPQGEPDASADGNPPGQECEQRDVAILRSLPGIGRIVLAVLLAEAWQALRRRDYHILRILAGNAPVTRRSGKSCIVLRRYACNRRLENALYHWARIAVQHDPTSRRRYADLRRRGHSHARALRTVGDRLLYVACTLLTRQTFYDPLHGAAHALAA